MRERLQRGDIVTVTVAGNSSISGRVLSYNEENETWLIMLDDFAVYPNGSRKRIIDVRRKEVQLVRAADES